MIFKVEAEGDTIFVEAETQAEAQKKLDDVFGTIPKNLITWTEDVQLPEGEEII